MNPLDPLLLAWAGIGFIGAFGAWKLALGAYHARRGATTHRASA